jgi:hypothetical protein
MALMAERDARIVLGRKVMSNRVVRRGYGLAAAVLAFALVVAPALAESDAPITIGFAMSATGPLASNGK